MPLAFYASVSDGNRATWSGRHIDLSTFKQNFQEKLDIELHGDEGLKDEIKQADTIRGSNFALSIRSWY